MYGWVYNLMIFSIWMVGLFVVFTLGTITLDKFPDKSFEHNKVIYDNVQLTKDNCIVLEEVNKHVILCTVDVVEVPNE